MELGCCDVLADVVAHLQNATLLAEGESDTFSIHKRWKSYRDRSGVAITVWNPVMVFVCACVYNYTMETLAEVGASRITEYMYTR